MPISYNPYSLEDKTILVTGASSGIGRTTAIECSKIGAKLIITARNRERLEQTYNALEGTGHKMVLCDLSNEIERDLLIEQCSGLDGLVNNAGTVEHKPIKFINNTNFNQMLLINTVNPIVLLSLLLKKKKINKSASIVFTSSIAGLGKASVGNGMYAASKGAISAFVPVAAKELASQSIRVNAVCPAMIKTEMTIDSFRTEEQIIENQKMYPLGRWGKTEEVANAIIYLLSDASSFTTGTNLLINGGI